MNPSERASSAKVWQREVELVEAMEVVAEVDEVAEVEEEVEEVEAVHLAARRADRRGELDHPRVRLAVGDVEEQVGALPDETRLQARDDVRG